ncbi:MAG TPA: hypothetical protein VHK67_03020 [Rhabdochlamydiaceae bacterium]|jgi:hypothetical protein|nr:hypothetical protein [Rhabdochlamydiaceae bacterium]
MMKKVAICFTLLLAQAWALSCTTPVTISEPGRDILYPSIAINEEGEVLALWVSENLDDKTETAMAATRDAEKKWTMSAISEPALEIGPLQSMTDHQGNHFVSWKRNETDFDGNELEYRQFAKKEKNKDWTHAVNAVSPEDQVKYPKMAFDSQGNVLFLTYDKGKDLKDSWNTYSVVSVIYSHQKDEVEKTNIGKKDGIISSQYLVKNRSGKVFAGWENTSYKVNTSVKILQGAWLQENGRWSDPTTFFSFSDNPYIGSGEKTVMNAKGDMAMIWSLSPRGSKDKTLQAITYFDGQWSEPFDLAVSKKGFYGVKLAMNDNGHIVAIWPQCGKNKTVISIIEKPAGQPWSSPVVLFDLSKKTSTPKISIDEQGNILVAWAVQEGRKEVPYAAYKPVNQEWVDPVRLSNGAQELNDLRIASNHQGSFVVLWCGHMKKQISIHGASLSTATKEWSSAQISPEGQDCGNFKCAFNKKGQGVIVWKTTLDSEDSYVQVAELNVN